MTSIESMTLLCPTAEETDLLRACLWLGAPGREAWTRWRRAVGDPEQAIRSNVSGIKSLLPLLHYGLRESEAELTASVNTILATAALAERLRYEAYAGICARVFDAFDRADIPFLVLRGASLAGSAYPERALRHSHDIDLLIHASDRRRATTALRQASFRDGHPFDPTATVQMVDASGLPVALHDRLLRFAFYAVPLDAVWARAQRIDCAGHPAMTLSADDHLVHICGHAATSRSRDGLKWVADAWFLLARNPALDWQRLATTVRTSTLALPLAVLLRYLTSDLGAAVPIDVLDELDRMATQSTRAARDVALSGVRRGQRGTFRNLMATRSTWRGRFEIARWMLLPSTASLRYGEPLPYPRAWPLYYAIRPLAYVARRAQRRLVAPALPSPEPSAATKR